MEGCHHHDGLGQHSRHAGCENDPQSCLVHSAGERPRVGTDYEGAEETEGQGALQKVAELAVIGSDDGGVVVLTEDAYDG